MPQSSSLVPVLGPVLAAIIAGAVAFLASVLSKELKTSEFRQAWIDGLRDDLSDLISIHFLLQDVLATEIRGRRSVERLQEVLREKQKEFERMEAAAARIRLRLNPQEHQVLLAAVQRLAEPSPALREGDVSESDSRGETVIRESQKVLKAEWKRVKRGEPIFVATKWASLLLVICSAALGVGLFFGKLVLTHVP
jgi:hypothetical protein